MRHGHQPLVEERAPWRRAWRGRTLRRMLSRHRTASRRRYCAGRRPRAAVHRPRLRLPSSLRRAAPRSRPPPARRHPRPARASARSPRRPLRRRSALRPPPADSRAARVIALPSARVRPGPIGKSPMSSAARSLPVRTLDHPGGRAGRGHVDGFDPGARMGGAHEHEMRFVGQRHVVDVFALAGEQPLVLAPGDGLADAELGH